MAGKKKPSEAPPESGRETENRFSKEQLIVSARFRERRDALEALLEAGELYTWGAVEEKSERYMKGKLR